MRRPVTVKIAHLILGHEPSMMFASPGSGAALRSHNKEQEDEANWLAGCLLLPRDALFSIRRRGLSDDEACREYGVSPAMLRFRLNASGVDIQLRRAEKWRGQLLTRRNPFFVFRSDGHAVKLKGSPDSD